MDQHNVCAGTFALMPIPDGLVPSIFCRKMEWRRLSKEETNEKLFISRVNWHFYLVALQVSLLSSILFPYLACKQKCFPPWKGINMENEATGRQKNSIIVVIHLPRVRYEKFFSGGKITKLIQSSKLFACFSYGNVEEKMRVTVVNRVGQKKHPRREKSRDTHLP